VEREIGLGVAMWGLGVGVIVIRVFGVKLELVLDMRPAVVLAPEFFAKLGHKPGPIGNMFTVKVSVRIAAAGVRVGCLSI
jgi:hypothetical protein